MIYLLAKILPPHRIIHRESGPMFDFSILVGFSNSCWEILLSIFGQKVVYIPTGF